MYAWALRIAIVVTIGASSIAQAQGAPDAESNAGGPDAESTAGPDAESTAGPDAGPGGPIRIEYEPAVATESTGPERLPPEQVPAPAPAPTRQSVATAPAGPASAPAETPAYPAPPTSPSSAPVEPEPEPVRYRRGGIYGIGIGAGLWFTLGGLPENEVLRPSIALDIKWQYPFGDYFGFEILFNAALWDYSRVGEAYAWYFDEDAAEKIGSLWFGLFFLPLLGCHMSLGPQLVIFSSGSAPAWWLDFGPAVSWILRPGDGRVLLGIDTQIGTGIDFSEDLSLALRFIISEAPVNSIFAANDTSGFSIMMTLSVLDP